MTTSEIPGVIETLQREGKLPATLTTGTKEAIAKSLARYFQSASDAKIGQMTDMVKKVAEAALRTDETERAGQTLKTTVGFGQSDARGILTDFLKETTGEALPDKLNMDFFIRVAREVASGAAQHLVQNFDQTRLDEFPALELVRVYDRDVPRGSAKDPAGPENGWDDDAGRWVAACDESGDEDAAQVFEDTGRMVALKASDVWQALGDGAGDYDDTLGNPFAPFAFNSGMDTDEVAREDAVALGLMNEDDEAEPAKTDFEDLLSLVE